MPTWAIAVLSFVAGAIAGGFVVWLVMSIAIVGDALDEGPGSEDEDYLAKPVELERRSLVRWKGLKVLP